MTTKKAAHRPRLGGKEKTVKIDFRLPESLAKSFKRYCKSEKVTPSEMIRRIVKRTADAAEFARARRKGKPVGRS